MSHFNFCQVQSSSSVCFLAKKQTGFDKSNNMTVDKSNKSNDPGTDKSNKSNKQQMTKVTNLGNNELQLIQTQQEARDKSRDFEQHPITTNTDPTSN